jgi:hypothetical protein
MPNSLPVENSIIRGLANEDTDFFLIFRFIGRINVYTLFKVFPEKLLSLINLAGQGYIQNYCM